MSSSISVGIIKLGCLGISVLLEYALDERADREDLYTITYSSGSKLTPDLSERVTRLAVEGNHDLYILVTPNASLPGPTRAREMLRAANKMTIIVSDASTLKIAKQLEEEGFGYIIVLADSMIGARREFLDPIEMTLYNSDIIRVLSVTGAYRVVCREIDRVIESMKRGERPQLPRVVVDKEVAIGASELRNPYARAKAMAAYEIARHVAELTIEGCFRIKEWDRYTMIVAAAHEMMRIAVMLADEAREIDKYSDTLVRTPHSRRGEVLYKERLLEKPRRLGLPS